MMKSARYGSISNLLIPMLLIGLYVFFQDYKKTDEMRDDMKMAASQMSHGATDQVASNWLNAGAGIDPDAIETAAGIEKE